ncbi:MAG: LysM peptidoglycan-binding domain-containing protein [Caldilineaceae bacterium]|nr:LysM peptidoglycan-binding domain-containing protein [Caldilineaceae bacterium]
MKVTLRLTPLTVTTLFMLGIFAWLGASPAMAAPRAQDAAPGDAPVIFAAGDVANCANEEDFLTAYLMDGSDAPILALGDNAYEIGSLQEYNDCYGPAWGRHRERTHPVPGNHEYGDQAQAGYWGYWGDIATPLEPGCRENCQGYYSFDVGAWHIVALNSEIAQDAGSEQEQWLRADLAAHPTACTLAYWHRPRFTSGRYYARTSGHALFQALYDYGADVLLVGHDHDYERFAPQNPSAVVEYDRGVRQFVVGTGGATLRDYYFIQPNSEVRNSETWGVLKLTLRPAGYDWEFIPIPGQTFTDSGSTDCVQLDSVPPAPAGVTLASTTADIAANTDEVAAPSSGGETTPDEAAQTAVVPPATTAGDGTYTVQSGDTLSTIGERFGVAWTAIAAANGLTEASVIQIGQSLVIPGVDAAATAAPVTQPTSAQSTGNQSTSLPASGQPYTVAAGDTLFSIAVRNGLTWQELAAANGLSENDFLQIGQVLVIPE